jgi:hypothetical protein
MKFKKRQVDSIRIMKGRESVYLAEKTANTLVTVFAHEDDETNCQLLGIELVNTKTGEVITQRINLPVTDMYIVSVKEILDVETGVLNQML